MRGGDVCWRGRSAKIVYRRTWPSQKNPTTYTVGPAEQMLSCRIYVRLFPTRVRRKWRNLARSFSSLICLTRLGKVLQIQFDHQIELVGKSWCNVMHACWVTLSFDSSSAYANLSGTRGSFQVSTHLQTEEVLSICRHACSVKPIVLANVFQPDHIFVSPTSGSHCSADRIPRKINKNILQLDLLWRVSKIFWHCYVHELAC